MQRALWLLVVVGCGGPATAVAPTAPGNGSTAAAPPGRIVETTELEAGAMHVRIDGTGIALAQLPMAEWLGLPMTGSGSIHVDLHIPVVHGARDYRGASGELALRCDGGCRLGDDEAKIAASAKAARTAELAGDGIEFGHIAFDQLAIGVRVRDGRAEVSEWTVRSPDLELAVTGAVQLGRSYDDSAVEACVKYKVLAGLRARDPKSTAALMTTGATVGGDGAMQLRVTGKIAATRLRSQICDGSQPLPPDDAPPVATRPEVPIPADSGIGSDDVAAEVAAGVRRIDDLHYELDKALADRILANPMAFAGSARIVPAMKNGAPDGFKLYAIRPRSLWAALGFLNGDTIVAINGFALTSADKALEVYTKLRDASELGVDLVRRGQPVTLTISIR